LRKKINNNLKTDQILRARRAGLQQATAGDRQISKLTRPANSPTTTVRTARVLPARTALLIKVNRIHKHPHIKPSQFFI